MDEILKNKWMTRLFFAGTALFFGGFVLYIVLNPRIPGYAWTRSRFVPSDTPVEKRVFRAGDRIPMVIEQEVRIGNNRYSYRGLGDGRIRIDVVIPDLDSRYAYPHRIRISEAKHGFRLAGRQFRLLSANGAKIRLLLDQ